MEASWKAGPSGEAGGDVLTMDAADCADLGRPAIFKGQSCGTAAPPPVQDIGPVYDVAEPLTLSTPFVFSSPHSGAHYADHFLAVSKLDATSIRKSEDAFVDELVTAAPKYGAPLLRAHFPRAYVDVNREAWELDPDMFTEPLPQWVNKRSLRVASGLGTIPRTVSIGKDIYTAKLSFAEAQWRIQTFYQPYHAKLRELIEQAKTKFGCAVLIDCHSMPSVGGPMDRDAGFNRADFVLGDRYGTSCSTFLTTALSELLRDKGYRVTRNTPYAGGYCTEHYGDRPRSIHAIQIEINRGLYMDETRIERSARFDAVTRDLSAVIKRMSGLSPDIFQTGP